MKQPPPAHRAVPVDRLREAVARAVERTSSHEVGKAVGLSAPAVRNFVAGAEPRAATVRRLTEWYVRDAAGAGQVDEETARAALGLLLCGVPADRNAEALRRALGAFREIYVTAGVVVPSWASSVED